MSTGEEIQLSFLKASSVGGTSWRTYARESIIGGTTADTYSDSVTIADTTSKVVIPISDVLFVNNIAGCTSISVRSQVYIGSTWTNVCQEMIVYPLTTPPAHAKRIWWLNALGGWDQYTFRGAYLKERETERSTYRKDLGYSYTVGARGIDTVKSKVTELHTIYSDALNSTDAAFVAGVLYSKDVRLQSGSTLIPIVLRDGSNVIDDSTDHVVIRLDYVHSNDVR